MYGPGSSKKFLNVHTTGKKRGGGGCRHSRILFEVRFDYQISNTPVADKALFFFLTNKQTPKTRKAHQINICTHNAKAKGGGTF